MYRLVSRDNIDAAVDAIIHTDENGLDTEAYGKLFNDPMFSLQIATAEDVWYFNFLDYKDGTPFLPVDFVMEELDPVFRDTNKLWFIHNAKFDLRRLSLAGKKLEGGVHCTQMCERFIFNHYTKYSFDACLKRRGMEKDDAVEKYIDEHKLYTDIILPDGKEERVKHFDKVPFSLMFPYACSDAERVRILGMDQKTKLDGKIYYINDLEMQKVAHDMEEIGMVVRSDYAQKGLEYERAKQKETEDRLSALAGEPFRNGPTWLRSFFDKHGVEYRINPKTGKPIFNKKALAEINHPIGNFVKDYRRHEKYAGTYYQHYAAYPVVYAQINLHGTDTGRFSYSEPNLQNVPKEEKLDLSIPYQVRGCFQPRPDHCFVMIDFNQQEFRLMLDYAGEHDLIKRINDHGEDIHSVMAALLGVSRTMAKTLNFGLLYGMGAEKLAAALGCSFREAKRIKADYFRRFSKIKPLIDAIIARAENRKCVFTWCGRPLFFPIRDFAYAAPNHVIQGGCGDIARFAMPQIHELLRPYKTNMLLQVHDELLFEMHKDELDLVDPIVKIMENTYKPFNKMRMTCGVDHSWISWGKRDVREGKPILQKSQSEIGCTN